jgi:hypothetical protein
MTRPFPFDARSRYYYYDAAAGQRRAAAFGGFGVLSFSPTLWLKLDDGSGTTPQDSSGNGNHGTFVNTPSYVVGPPAALDFTGADRDAVQVTGTLGEPAAVTIMGWIELDAADTSETDVISIADSVLIRMANTQLQGFYRSSGGAYDNIDHVVSLAGDGYHHFAYVAATGRQELYLDAVSVGSKTNGNAIGYLAGNFLLGRHSSETTRDFDGRMHDVLVFPSALSTTQIAAIMTATT